jgi:hypothetical protein
MKATGYESIKQSQINKYYTDIGESLQDVSEKR